MKAFRFHGKGDLRLEDIDEPRCGDDQVKVSSQSVIAKTSTHDSRSNLPFVEFVEQVSG